ncbi:MAG TPA: energy transducer TonB [Terriglobales bacterium]|nr:energy transducer TonB [Terriglobales bacterium]
MNRQAEAEELNREIETLLAGEGDGARDWQSLIADLRYLPNPDFKAQLKSELVEIGEIPQSVDGNFEHITETAAFAEILPSLGGSNYRFLPADQRSFLVSFVSHTALIVLIASGILIGTKPASRHSDVISELTYVPTGQNGGGGSGDRSPVPVSKGTPPRMTEQQLAPPVIVVHRSNPLLPVPATIVGPPNLRLPQSNQIGDLVSPNIAMPSNGTGTGGGAGNGTGTGLGSGVGLGAGPGFERGTGGGPYRPGAGVIAPRALYDPEPEYSEEARKVKAQGTVVLSLIVDEQGRPREIHVARSLGMGLDQKAIDAVKKWKFVPGTKDGLPVAVQVNVEVSFRLY